MCAHYTIIDCITDVDIKAQISVLSTSFIRQVDPSLVHTYSRNHGGEGSQYVRESRGEEDAAIRWNVVAARERAC